MKKNLLLLFIISVILQACSNKAKQTFGLSKSSIDEFQVIKKSPLIIPPNLNLRPPSRSRNSSVGSPKDKVAREFVFGLERDLYINVKDKGEVELLRELGALKSDPNIKRKLSRLENIEKIDEGLLKKILSLKPLIKRSKKTNNVINPYEEKEKLYKK